MYGAFFSIIYTVLSRRLQFFVIHLKLCYILNHAIMNPVINKLLRIWLCRISRTLFANISSLSAIRAA